MNDAILNKKASIERCIQQIKTYYALDTGVPFASDYLKQDAIALNLQRICEMTIDIANHLVRRKKLGLPQGSRDSFALLHQAGLLSTAQMQQLQAMVGFRNILVHQYQALSLQIMVDVIENHLGDLLEFADRALGLVD